MNNTRESPEITPNKQAAMSDKSLKLIKTASIIMGIFIIFGFIALILGLQQKLSDSEDPYSEAEFSISEGQKILSVSSDAEGGMILWIENSDASETKQLIQHIDQSGTVKKRLFIKVD